MKSNNLLGAFVANQKFFSVEILSADFYLHTFKLTKTNY